MSEHHERDEPHGPEVMFLPLAVSDAEGFRGFDPSTYARRLPDFLHQVLNEGHVGPTAMLELQSTTEQGPVRWVQFDEPPDRDEAFELLPPGLEVRAVVTGELAATDLGLRVEFHVYRSDDDAHVTAKVGGTLSFDDPVAGLLRLARHLARLL